MRSIEDVFMTYLREENIDFSLLNEVSTDVPEDLDLELEDMITCGYKVLINNPYSFSKEEYKIVFGFLDRFIIKRLDKFQVVYDSYRDKYVIDLDEERIIEAQLSEVLKPSNKAEALTVEDIANMIVFMICTYAKNIDKFKVDKVQTLTKAINEVSLFDKIDRDVLLKRLLIISKFNPSQAEIKDYFSYLIDQDLEESAKFLSEVLKE